jgi:hypothetical protein
MGQLKFIHQSGQSLRLFQGIEILPLDILDEREAQSCAIRHFLHDRRDLV